MPKEILIHLKNIGITLFFIIISCSGHNIPENHTIEIIDGYKTVRNMYPLELKDKSSQLEFIRKIGGLDANEDILNFYYPIDITSDHNENLFILDRGNHRIVRIFNDSIEAFGTKGNGPGEFTYPVNIDLDVDGNLVIADNKKYHVFTTNGEFIRTKTMNFSLYSLKTLKSGLFLDKCLTDSTLMRISNTNGKIISKFGEPLDNEDRQKFNLMNRVYITSGNNGFFVSFKHSNLIQKYSIQGKLLLNITRKLAYDISYEPIKTSMNKRGEIVRTGRGFSLVSKGIAIDNNDRLWVITAGRQESDEEHVNPVYSIEGRNIKYSGNSPDSTNMYKLELYNNQGILLSEVRLNHYCDDINIFGDRLLIIDSIRGMCVYEYKIKDL